ncbi:hypothetical protein Ancab_019334 [Ancistrocladus abbreviatus]
MYDADVILRILSIFLNLDEDEDDDNNQLKDESEMMYDLDSPNSLKQSSIVKVSKLLDNYLAEVALDLNLTASRFIAFAELLPDHARLVTNGLYRAVDIFLKFTQRHFPKQSSSGAGIRVISPKDSYASVRRENQELKLQVARIRMRLTDLEKNHISMK